MNPPEPKILSDATVQRLARDILERLVRSDALAEILSQIVSRLEAESQDGLSAALMLLNDAGTQLFVAAAGSLPPGWVAVVDGLETGPSAGSCGTAAHSGAPVYVDDLSVSPLWAEYREAAASHGLASCSSLPITTADGKVAGTLAAYSSRRQLPSPHDRALLETARYLAGIALDRERVQQALRDSEADFRTLANTIPQLAWMAHPDGNIFWYNQRWFEYTGTTLEDMQGWGWQSVHDPEVLPQVTERWKASLESGSPFEMEFPLRGSDGVLRTFLTRVAPILDADGQVLRWFGTNTDIDEQRRSVERTRTLVEATSQAIWTADAEGQVKAPSGSWSQLTGQSWQDMRGAGWLEAAHPEDRARVAQAWRTAIETGETFSQEFRLWSTLNRFIHIRAKGVPVLNRQGRVLEWIVANTDVTEQVEAKQQLQERARYAAFRSILKEALHTSDAWQLTAERCCAAMTAQLGLAGGAIWEDRDGDFVLIAHDGDLPSNATTLLRVIADSPRGAILNSLATPDEPGLGAVVGHPLLQDGRTLGVLIGFSRSILPVNLSEELRDAAEALAIWLQQNERLRAAEDLLRACGEALPEHEGALAERLAEYARRWRPGFGC